MVVVLEDFGVVLWLISGHDVLQIYFKAKFLNSFRVVVKYNAQMQPVN